MAGSLGGGIHDGHLYSAPPARKVLGSRLLFRESGEAGYQLTRSVSLSVMLDHLSNAGLALNTAGATNYAYAGLTWRGRPWRRWLALPEGLFVAGSLGGGIHDGHLNSGPPDRKLLGSRLLFRESVEAGYQLTRRVSLSVMLDHLSNADLAVPNQGLTNFGARIGVTF